MQNAANHFKTNWSLKTWNFKGEKGKAPISMKLDKPTKKLEHPQFQAII